MQIILDGCDGTGKTTVSEKLANKLGCNIIRWTYAGDRSYQAYLDLMSCDNVVHDRSFISEMIYPKYFGRDSRLDASIVPILFDVIKSFGIKTFILTAKPETILERIGKRGDEFIDDNEKLVQINQDYLDIAKEKGFTVIDTTDKTIDEIVEEIINDCR